jgi:hypothetical protein
MKLARFFILALAAGAIARADFSYTTTRKSSAAAPAPTGEQSTKFYLKGQKMLSDMGNMAILIDFDAQTVTTISKIGKSYSVKPFGEMGQTIPGGTDMQVDFKETGEHKTINGFDAAQSVMTMQMEVSQGMKMQMEMEFWTSPDVPGAQELHAFYQRNMGKFPWTAMMGGAGNPSAQKALVEMQKRLASMNGVPVLEVVRVKPGGNSQQAAQMQQGMAQARARLEAMAAQGGPQADAAKQALARMGGMSGGVLSETTMESSGFSTNSIPDSVFAIPAGFSKSEK